LHKNGHFEHPLLVAVRGSRIAADAQEPPQYQHAGHHERAVIPNPIKDGGGAAEEAATTGSFSTSWLGKTNSGGVKIPLRFAKRFSTSVITK